MRILFRRGRGLLGETYTVVYVVARSYIPSSCRFLGHVKLFKHFLSSSICLSPFVHRPSRVDFVMARTTSYNILFVVLWTGAALAFGVQFEVQYVACHSRFLRKTNLNLSCKLGYSSLMVNYYSVFCMVWV